MDLTSLSAMLPIAQQVLQFWFDNWEFALLIPLAYKYVKEKAWNKLINLAINSSLNIKNHDISNVVKHDTVKESLKESVLSKLFTDEMLDKIVKIAYHTEVKEDNSDKLNK